MNDKKARKSFLPHFLLSDILLISCCIVSAALFVIAFSVPLKAVTKKFVLAAGTALVLYDLVYDAVKKLLLEHEFDQNLLVVLAAAGTFAIGRGEAGAAAALIFRAGAVLNRLIAEHSVNKAESMLDIRQETVNAVINGDEVQLSAGKIKVGDFITVAPGEYIAFDGIVAGGESMLNTSVMTGESQPVLVAVGSMVISGSLNLIGALKIRVTSDFDNSALSRAVKYINNAKNRKSRPEKFAEWLSRLFMPGAGAVALIVGLIVPLIGGLSFAVWLNRALGILFISSLSMQMLMIRLAYYCSVAGAFKKGILFKGADVVDTLAHTTSIVIDMTGILTTGRFEVTDIKPNGLSPERLLILAAYAAAYADMPVMQAIAAKAGTEVDYAKISGYRKSDLGGYEVEVGSVTVSAGSEAFMAELGITPDISYAEATAVYVSANGRYAGRILLSDSLRPDSKKAVRLLKSNGVDRIAMFTGDNKAAAVDVATQIGILELYDEILPDEKTARLGGLHDMQLKGDRLIFVGDTCNDPAVLKKADAGIIMGGLGQLSAEEAADMIIMSQSLSKVSEAIVLARLADRIVRQNLLALLGIKCIALLLLLTGVFPVWAGVLADVAMTFAANINSARAFGISRQEYKERNDKRQ